MNPELVPVTNRRGDQKQKPSIVWGYNDRKSVIDHTDQMLSYHSALGKTLQVYKSFNFIKESLFGDVFS